MTAFVVVPGFGGVADFDFVAPMLARQHSVSLIDVADPLTVAPEAVLVGYSLGAVLAAAHAADHPVGGLVLICGWTQSTPRLVDWSIHASDEAFARHTMVGPGSDRSPLVRPELLARVDSLPVPVLGTIACPTLVIGATFDLVATAHQSRLVHGGIADSRYVEVATGHAALIERPAEVLSLLTAFAAQQAAQPALHR